MDFYTVIWLLVKPYTLLSNQTELLQMKSLATQPFSTNLIVEKTLTNQTG